MIHDQIIAALEHPDRISHIDEESLREVIKNFPYFKEAQLMLTKLMHEKKHLHFHRQLKLAALYSNDRKLLYELIYQQQLISAIDQFSHEESVQKAEKDVKDQYSSPKEPETGSYRTPPTEENATSTDHSVSQEAENKEEEVTQFAQPIPITQLSFTTSENPSEQEDFEVAQEAEATTERPEETQDLGQLEKEILSHAFSLETSYEQLPAEISSQDEKPAKSSSQPISTATHQEALQAKSLNDWLHTQTQQRAEKKSQEKAQTQKLIDEFIQNDPQIPRSDQMAFDNPVDAARMSIVDNEEFVTETLAKIYANQGNTGKAISVYKKLMLKYPEKKTYFAGLIQKLKN